MRTQTSRILLLLPILTLLLTLYPMGAVQGDPGSGTATLRVSLPAGNVTGSDPDPWLNEGWLLNLTGTSWTFTVRVNQTSSAHKSYDTHLIVALNNASHNNLLTLTINSTTITGFQYGRPNPYGLWNWSDDVYPTWFNDTGIHLGTLEPWEHKDLNVSVTFSDPTGARMHFDAYGKDVPGKIKKVGDITWSPHSQDSTVVAAAVPPGIPPHAEFTYSPTYPIACETVAFNASNSTDPNGHIVSYTWYFENNNITTVTDPVITHHYATYGNYTVTLMVTDNETLTDYAKATVNVREYPVANFTFTPTTPLVGETVTFNASSSTPNGGVIVNYTWNFDDSNTTTVNNPIITHVYAGIKKYNVTLTVTDSEGLSDTTWNIVKVVTQPTSPIANFTWSPPKPTVNETVTFDASSSQPGFDGFNVCPIAWYYWDFGDGDWANETDPITTHVYTAPGTYYVNLTVYGPPSPDDPSYDPSGSITIPITITTGPHAEFTYSPLTPYTGETVTFNATLSYDPDGWIVTYAWDFGDTNNGTGNITTHAYADDGTYTVILNVTDNDGLSSTASANITVLNRPPVADFTENATTVYTGEVISFNAASSYDPDGSIASYFWDFGDGNNDTGMSVDHSYSAAGNYTVTLIVTDDDGATDSADANKTVLEREYYLTVETDPAGIVTILGGGWYDNSTDVILTAPTVVNYNFINWDVGGVSQGSGVNPITVHMDGPHTATAHYQAVGKPVGGYATPIDKPQLMYPWMSPASVLVVAILLTIFLVIYRKQDHGRTLTVP